MIEHRVVRIDLRCLVGCFRIGLLWQHGAVNGLNRLGLEGAVDFALHVLLGRLRLLGPLTASPLPSLTVGDEFGLLVHLAATDRPVCGSHRVHCRVDRVELADVLVALGDRLEGFACVEYFSGSAVWLFLGQTLESCFDGTIEIDLVAFHRFVDGAFLDVGGSRSGHASKNRPAQRIGVRGPGYLDIRHALRIALDITDQACGAFAGFLQTTFTQFGQLLQVGLGQSGSAFGRLLATAFLPIAE